MAISHFLVAHIIVISATAVVHKLKLEVFDDVRLLIHLPFQLLILHHEMRCISSFHLQIFLNPQSQLFLS
jgi:hypothetical protein